MNLEFLSGLALIVATLGVLAYTIKEYFDIRAGDLKDIRHYLDEVLRHCGFGEAKPVNDHLIGAIGKVTAHTGDSDGPMRVRVNLESWPARLSSSADGLAPVGTSVKVTEVDGLSLIVEADDLAELQARSN